jgi:hypothetical protein
VERQIQKRIALYPDFLPIRLYRHMVSVIRLEQVPVTLWTYAVINSPLNFFHPVSFSSALYSSLL